MGKCETTLNLDKETQNTVRYKEEGTQIPTIGTLYLQKYLLKDGQPKKIKVTVEWD